MGGELTDISLALIGIGGYGNSYLSALLDKPTAGVRLVAGVDPSPRGCNYLPQLKNAGIPVYGSMEQMWNRHQPQLVIICTPLHLHCDQTIAALGAGCHVLCEKPLCGSPEQALEMLGARELSGKQVSIGYQWSFNRAVGELKHDISAGLFGRPRRLKTLVLWPRDQAYYRRNTWAGRCYSSSGSPVFDSPINNACAHHLHHMLYVLGEAPDRSAMPVSVSAELYRANDIETFDTAAVRLWTAEGVEILYVVSHATQGCHGPWFTFEFEHATITFKGEQPTELTQDGAGMFARFADGRVKSYGSPEQSPDRKLWAAVKSARFNEPTVCGIEAALSQALTTAAVHRSMPTPVDFPSQMIRLDVEDGIVRRSIAGLQDVLLRCYADGVLPAEMGVPWAVAGRTIDLTGRSTQTMEPVAKFNQGEPILSLASARPATI